MEHVYYLEAIKNFLRIRKIHYTELAKALLMTESGIKKMLNAKDISFRRVLQIADFLEVSPSQLLAAAETSSIPTIHLTKKQEEALLDDEDLLAVFWRFVVEKNNEQEIAKRQNWPTNKVIKILEKLCRLDLVTKSKKCFMPVLPHIFRLADDSNLARKLNREWSIVTVERALHSKQNESGFHRLLTLKLRQDSYNDFVHRSKALFDDIVRLSEREALQYNQVELKAMSTVVAVVQSGALDTVPSCP
jgi:DNA-binding Xre family transcriptional regulator